MTARTAREPASDQTAPLFYERWSPKSFKSQRLTDEELETLFDAARWAPSSYNEQPWRFVFSRTEEERDTIAGTLNEGNRQWAGHAPHLAILLTKKHFSENGRPNRVAEFDAGSAWMSFTLQAQLLDIATHGMAGFSEDRVVELLGIDPDEFKPMCVFAFGYPGDDSDLPEEVDERTDSSPRKPIDEIAIPVSDNRFADADAVAA